MRRLCPRPRMAPWWTSTAPMGMPPSASPCSASSIAANKKGSITHQYRRAALVFLVVGLIAALLGFTSIAGASIAIAKFLAGLFLLLFLVFLIIGLAAGRRIMG